MIHRFELAPLDKTARLFSILPMIALAVCSFGLLWLIPFLFSPRDYRVTPRGIVIRTPVTSCTISAGEIKSVAIIGPVKQGALLSGNNNRGYAGLFALADGSAAAMQAMSSKNWK